MKIINKFIVIYFLFIGISMGQASFPNLVVDITMNEPSGDKILDAGEEGSLVFTITNTGRGDAQDFTINIRKTEMSISGKRAILQNNISYMQNIWLPGIKSNDEKIVSTPLIATNDLVSGHCVFYLSFEEGSGFFPDPIEFKITTRSLVAPKYELIDILISNDAGNEKIEPGNVCEINLRIANSGGSARNVQTSFNFGNSVISTQKHLESVNVGKVEGGGYFDMKFEFFINNRAEDEIPLYYSISDASKKADIIKERVPIWKNETTRRKVTLVGTTSGIDSSKGSEIPTFVRGGSSTFSPEDLKALLSGEIDIDDINLGALSADNNLLPLLIMALKSSSNETNKEHQVSLYFMEDNEPLRSMAFLINGIEYETDEDGEILYNYLDSDIDKKIKITLLEDSEVYAINPSKFTLSRRTESKNFTGESYHTLINFTANEKEGIQGLALAYDGSDIGEILPSGFYKLMFSGYGKYEINISGEGYEDLVKVVKLTKRNSGKEREIDLLKTNEPLRYTVNIIWAGPSSSIPVEGKLEINKPYQVGYLDDDNEGRYSFEFFDRSVNPNLTIIATDPYSGAPFKTERILELTKDENVYKQTEDIIIGTSPEIKILVDGGKKFSVLREGNLIPGIEKQSGSFQGKLPGYGLYQIVQFWSGKTDTTNHAVYTENIEIDLRRGDQCNKVDNYLDDGDWASFLDQVDRLTDDDDCYCDHIEEAGRVAMDELKEYDRAVGYLNKIASEQQECGQWKSPYLHLRRLKCFVEIDDNNSYAFGTDVSKSFQSLIQLIDPSNKKETLCQNDYLLGRLMYQEHMRKINEVNNSKNPSRIERFRKEAKLIRRVAIQYIEEYEANGGCQSLQSELSALKG